MDNRAFEKIPEIKRFIEVIGGFSGIASKVKKDGAMDFKTLEEHGLHFSEEDVSAFINYFMIKEASSQSIKNESLESWKEWSKRYTDYVDIYRKLGDTSTINSNYYKWKNIQIKRCESELGKISNSLIHGLCAFELSEGCSIGCKFCGLNSESYKSYFHYNPENKNLWRDILNYMKECFGSAAQTSVCYWATEPSDNPDYFNFLTDYKEIIGIEPQTTTAITKKRMHFIRELIDFHKSGDIFSRISVLSENILKEIHEQFTAEELRNIILLFNYEENFMKINSGRNISNTENTMDGTIACISGFLINMCTRTLKLVSPCKASEKWPLGYKIFASYTFNNIIEFKQIINHCCNYDMQLFIKTNDNIKLRDDITLVEKDNILNFQSPYTEQSIVCQEINLDLGTLIGSGNISYNEICESLLLQGANYMSIVNLIQNLYESGIIEINNSNK